jgi:HPt (histidine-containing phosphotransfer) domain-containing protein
MEISGYRFAATLKRLEGDQRLFQELAVYFIEDAPALLQAIRAGVASGNAGDSQRAAHSLRGLLANFDAEQALAGSVEDLCGNGELQRVPEALAPLEMEVQSLRDALRQFTPQSLAAARPR